jgi:Ca2+-binding EF-hand superfamily protein
MMRRMPLMAALDANSDGVISSEEIEKSPAALKTLDKNSDGQLTADELRPAFGGRREGERPPQRPPSN